MLQMLRTALTSLRTAWAFFKRDFLITASYKTAFAADALGIVFKVITFYYIGAVIKGSVAPSLSAYRHDYFGFLIIGIALLDFVHTSLDTFSVSIRDSQMTGTLEVVLLSPIQLPHMVIYSSLWPYVFTALRFATYIGTGVVLFHLQIAPAGILTALVVLLLTIFCFAPLGIICAAVIMLFKKGVWFQTLINGTSVLLAGVAYPVTVLPPWAAKASNYLPLTHSVTGMRQALLNGKSLFEIGPQLTALAAFAAVLMPLSLIVFQLSVSRTKQLGTLTQY
jgi:ABC-2 type transport system permease protein